MKYKLHNFKKGELINHVRALIPFVFCKKANGGNGTHIHSISNFKLQNNGFIVDMKHNTALDCTNPSKDMARNYDNWYVLEETLFEYNLYIPQRNKVLEWMENG